MPKDPYYPDIVVPIDFLTIQKAIDAANEGDVIKVLPGTYTEQLNITKSLTIIGSGAKSTIIETPLPLEDLDTNIIGRPYIVEVNNEAEVTMKGFTIKGLEDATCDVLFGVTVLGDATLKLYSAIIKDCTFASG
jgi:pectin methylesterase-like acyl-CoA thioesterase